MDYFSRKYAGLSYAVNYLRNKTKTDIDNKLQTERDSESERNTFRYGTLDPPGETDFSSIGEKSCHQRGNCKAIVRF